MRIHDVAKQLRVSVATVSRALNPSTQHLVSKKTKERIQRYVREIGYVPNRTAQQLSTGKTHTLGVALPAVFESIFANDYLIKVLAGVHKALEENAPYNCKILILSQGKLLTDLEHSVSTLGVDGLLLSAYCDFALCRSTPPTVPKNLLAQWQKPVVIMNLQLDESDRFSCVYFDQMEAAQKAVTYMIQKGHKDIAMIQGDPKFPDAQQRLEGYKAALENHGLKFRPSWIPVGNFLMEMGYRAGLNLFRDTSGKKPTAVFCANDEMAIGCMKALKALRIRCPQDVAVIGFDGIDLGEFVDPRLTSLSQPLREIAENSTRLLIRLIEEEIPTPISEAVPSQIIVRDSA